MLDPDTWQEIFSTLSKNKLRTFLTGFSVAWGIFMLIILLAAGNGLENGVFRNFEGSLQNSLWVWRGVTSKPYKGLKEGRYIALNNDDHDALKQNIPEIEIMSSRQGMPGQNYVAYKDKSVKYQVLAVHPGYEIIDKHKVLEGRILNDLDIQNTRKVLVISDGVRDEFFKHESPLNKYINVNGFLVKVVGVIKDNDNNNIDQCVYLPITTAQLLSGGKKDVNLITLTIPASSSLEKAKEIEKTIRREIARIHKFDPEDDRAIHVSNNVEQARTIMGVINSIRIFIWVIGIMTIVAGIVGVSNIMTIVVKERTREIGIRKALGARPTSIIGLIMQEAVLITSTAGFIGLLSGTALLVLIKGKFGEGNRYFYNPDVDLRIAIGATVLLIVAGLLAGFFPARKAAKIRPVLALRDE